MTHLNGDAQVLEQGISKSGVFGRVGIKCDCVTLCTCNAARANKRALGRRNQFCARQEGTKIQ